MSAAAVSRIPDTPPGPQQRPASFTVVLFEREVIVPASAQTLEGFRAWALSEDFPERGRYSFLDGEVFIDLSPEELETHNKVKGEIGRVLLTLNKNTKLGSFYSDGALLTNEKANLSTEPDALFVTWEGLKAGRVRRVERKGEDRQYTELVGTPDWVLEVISDSSVRKDTKRLREEYHRADIGEYWLIDARGEKVEFQILLRGETDYESAAAERGGWLASRVFQRRFRLRREEEQLDSWDYTLEVKPRR
jgi:Uma2 family endonuclease